MLEDDNETNAVGEESEDSVAATVSAGAADENNPETDAVPSAAPENGDMPDPGAEPVPDADAPDGDLPGETDETGESDEPDADGEPDPDVGEGEEDGTENGDGEPGEDGGEDGDGAPAFPVVAVVEALLFAAREPLKAANLARAVGKGTRQDAVKAAIDELNVQYLETGRAFEIAEISGRYQLMSRPEYADHIRRIYPKRELEEREKTARLTPAAKETLSIIAYKQPVTRAEIERIRGVGCGPVLKALIERGTVRVAGKLAEVIGQPLVYGTTEAFLTEFGLGSLDELPMRNDFLAMLGDDPSAAAIAPENPPEESQPTDPQEVAEASGEAEDRSVAADAETPESVEDGEPAADV